MDTDKTDAGTKIDRRSRQTGRLSDVDCRQAKPKDKAYPLADGAGLYLWTTPAGARTWRWQYRHDSGDTRQPLALIVVEAPSVLHSDSCRTAYWRIRHRRS